MERCRTAELLIDVCGWRVLKIHKYIEDYHARSDYLAILACGIGYWFTHDRFLLDYG